ncbi:MAG: amidohydrolase [Intrasporangium sp.]|uniref:amidohydrolase n=1 Tax=Intrasporangium sp. TaxID=1925024 RepID=UPI0026491308|nr:amidohydrolase [Intrasporangium sp.]MDN5794778.1 amidohydrolase [Intrasporangium sp.]
MDTILHNANVIVGDATGRRAASLGLAQGRVVALEVDSALVDPDRRVDLRGRTVVPGFHDAHCHTTWYGLSLRELPLDDPKIRDLDDVYAAVAAAAATQPEGGWIIGRGWHPLRLGGRSPRLPDLDRITTRHPVWLVASSGHASVVNSVILRLLDFTHLSARRPLQTDEQGQPTGLLEEDAHACVLEQARPYLLDDVVAAIGRAHDQYLRVGITSAQEAGVGAGLVGYGGAEMGAYQVARERGRLRVRTTLMPSAKGLHDLHQSRGETLFGLGLGVHTGFGDDRLRIGPVKFFTDGSVLAGTAGMHGGPEQPYYDHEWLRRRIIDAHRSGWQLAIHAQGDAAVDFVLDCLEESARRYPRHDPRHRIEHASIATDQAVARMARLGVIPDPQGRFVGVVGDGLLDLLDPAQLANTYRSRTFLAAGLVLPGSSDRPCTEGIPMLGIHDMVNRRTDSGRPFGLEEALTPTEALRAYSHGSAYATFAEDRLGTLAEGQHADLVVLDADPTEVAPESIREIEVLATYVAGQLVHDRDGRWAR